MKRVYLDQMKWVDLLKATKGRPDGEAFQDALTLAEAAVDAGYASFPVSAIHYVETYKRAKWESRHDLGQVIGRLSRHHTIAPQEELTKAEIRRALYALAGAPPPPRPQAFGVGVGFAFADSSFKFKVPAEGTGHLPADVRVRYEQAASEFMENMMHTGPPPQWQEQLAVDNPDRDPTAHLALAAEAAANEEQLRDVRAREGWNKGERSVRLFMTQAFTDNFETFHAVLGELGIPHEGFYETLGRDGMSDLLRQIPTLSVATEFRRQRHISSQKTIDANDAHDQASLPPAIVYCDVVVTERSYARQLQDLAREHNTVLLHDLADLPQHLVTVELAPGRADGPADPTRRQRLLAENRTSHLRPPAS